MKRIQVKIDYDVFCILKRLGREKTMSISELVRDAVKKVYAMEMSEHAEDVLREAAGIWKDRKDIRSADQYVRQMRKSTRNIVITTHP